MMRGEPPGPPLQSRLGPSLPAPSRSRLDAGQADAGQADAAQADAAQADAGQANARMRLARFAFGTRTVAAADTSAAPARTVKANPSRL